MKKILLTGASGLLGAHLLKLGLAQGLQFKVISRSVSKRSYLHVALNDSALSPLIEYIPLDLMETANYPSTLFDEVETIIHAAAWASPFERDRALMEKLHVDCSKNLYALAQKAEVKNWVQISTVATLCNGTQSDPVDESHIGELRDTAYAQTKYQFDQWLDLQGNQQDDQVKKLIIHPCYMLGGWDARPSSGSLFFALKLKKIAAILDTHKNIVHAADVAQGIFQALKAQVNGHYILGHHNLKLRDFLAECLKALQIPNQIENIQTLSLQALDELELPMDRLAMIRELSLAGAVSSAKASQDFNYHPKHSLAQIIADTISYFEAQRLLRIKHS